MKQSFRLPAGGLVDRSRPLGFEYDGVRYEGFAGDTLASALLANGVHLVARSFKYHRPRDIYTAGVEEPNALVQLARGARTEPNTRATTLELYEGLVARSQNCWPSVRFDMGAIMNAMSPVLPAGFYYKTFMWPPGPAWWLKYERLVRNAAGIGRAPASPDPDRYDHQYAHCDVLVVGAGPAGLAAARAAAVAGARVIVCQQTARCGSKLFGAGERVGERSAEEWVDSAVAALRSHPDVTLLPRTTAIGCYDDSLVAAVERVTDHLASPPGHLPRQRLWMIRARSVVLAAGAIERGIAFGDNDRPGILLAGAACAYVKRFGVRPGSRAVVFTNNDTAYAAALALRDAGVEVAAVVDARAETAREAALAARAGGLEIIPASVITRARGGRRVAGVEIAPRGGGAARRIDCDLVAVAGGFNPAVHLFSHARGTLRYDARSASFVPESSPLPVFPAGSVAGIRTLEGALREGEAAASRALAHAFSWPVPRRDPAAVADTIEVDALWSVPAAGRPVKAFVDLHDDVTVRDVEVAAHEGYESVEHLKRYTTLGMGTDQGKISNVTGLALLAEKLGASIPAVGTTTFRPPYAPATFGTIAGPARGPHFEPTRRTPMHAWHAEQGARFVNAGLWKRPHSYPRPGESEDEAAAREARNVRDNVGLVDVSTLGKIELQGRDVVALLDRLYVNGWGTLREGRCRYGLMLREDGIVRDDGTTSRLAPDHYLMTTTTANAAAIMQSIERALQADWPELAVHATSVTEQWAAAALSGPKSRDVLARLVDIDVSNAAFPFLAVGTCRLHTGTGDIPARLLRMSYSGELAYEIHVPSTHGRAMWEAVLEAGRSFGIMPYGTEAMNTLRVEKGHVVVGSEIDGRTTADDLGMARLVSPAKWCIGKPLLSRPALNAPDRWQLVGLTALDGATIPRGGKLVAEPDAPLPNRMLGQVTSWCFSPHVDAWIALGLLAAGRSRHGETVWAVSPLAGARARVRVGPPCAIDPQGERLRG